MRTGSNFTNNYRETPISKLLCRTVFYTATCKCNLYVKSNQNCSKILSEDNITEQAWHTSINIRYRMGTIQVMHSGISLVSCTLKECWKQIHNVYSKKLVLEVTVLQMVPYSVRLTHLANTQNCVHDIQCTVHHLFY